MLSHGCLSQRLILGDLCATFVVLSLPPEGLGVCRLNLRRSPLWVRLVGLGRLGPAPVASRLACPRRGVAPGTACPSRLLVKPWSWPSFLLQLKGQVSKEDTHLQIWSHGSGAALHLTRPSVCLGSCHGTKLSLCCLKYGRGGNPSMRMALCSGVLTTESWHGPVSCWELGTKGVRRQRRRRLSRGFEPPVFLTSQFSQN